MKKRRSHHTSILIEKKLYVFFGLSIIHLFGYNKTVERLDLDKWRKNWINIEVQNSHYGGYYNIISFLR